MTTDCSACFSINKQIYLPSLSLYVFKLLLLLRSLKIDFWSVRHMRHRSVGRSRSNSARSLRLEILTQLAVKNLTPQRHELPTNKSAAAACHLRADKQMDEYIGHTDFCMVVYTHCIRAGRHPDQLL